MISLDRIDSAPVSHDEFSFVFSSWFSVLVDTLNETLLTLENQINGIGDATFATRKTTAEIVALIDMNATPVLPVGSLWIDTTIGKLKFISVAAIPGIANGITETVTSV